LRRWQILLNPLARASDGGDLPPLPTLIISAALKTLKCTMTQPITMNSPAKLRHPNRLKRRLFLEQLEERRVLAAGDLDLTFGGGDGIVLTDVLAPTYDVAYDVEVQPDGKVLVGGSSNGKGTIARYNADGSPDLSFGNGAGFVIATDMWSAFGMELEVLPSGRIIAAANTRNDDGTLEMAVIAYGPDGSRDWDFGEGDSIATLSVYQTGTALTDLAVDADGKLILTGYQHYYTGEYSQRYLLSSEFLVARLNADGSTDTGFGGGDGYVTTEVSSNQNVAAKSVAVQPDGKLVVAGTSDNYYDFSVVRYNPDGSLDNTFGYGGRSSVDSLDYTFDVGDVAIDVANNIYVTTNGYEGTTVNRLSPEGFPDESFGLDGHVSTQTGWNYRPGTMILQDDGKILVGADSWSEQGHDLRLTQYLNNGTLDLSFGGDDGIATISVGSNDFLYDFTLSEGAIFAAGSFQAEVNQAADFALLRYASDGTPDLTFGEAGLVTTGFGLVSGDTEVYSLAVALPDGKLITITYTSNRSYYDVVRYDVDGALDTTFGGGDGIAELPFVEVVEPKLIAVQPDGKIVIAGSAWSLDSQNQTYDFFAIRLRDDGAVDSTFGAGDGLVTLDLGSYEFASDLVVQVDGKLVLSGTTYDELGNTIYALVRYHTDGSLDETFGTGGVATTVSEPGGLAGSLLLQPDGKLIVAGNVVGTFLSRFNPDGTLDGTFGGDGGILDLTVEHTSLFAELQADGKVIVAGINYSSGTIGLLRYNADGNRDDTFGVGGVVNTGLAGGTVPVGVIVQPDGRIVLGASKPLDGVSNWPFEYDWTVSRFEPNGSPDLSFGSGPGFVSVNLGTAVNNAIGITAQPSGRIVMIGQPINEGTGQDIALVGFERGPLLTTAEPRPDVAIPAGGISFSSVNPAPGEIVTVSVTVKNVGQAGTTNVPVTIKDFGTVLGTVMIDSLAPGETRTVSVEATFSSTGYRLISAEADPLSAIAELNERNNSTSQVLQIGQPTVSGATIAATVHDRTAYEGTFTTITGSGFYDFAEVAGTKDYAVKGGLVTLQLINPSTGLIESAYSGVHTATDGSFSVTILTPLGARTLDLHVTITDASVSGEDAGQLHIVVPEVTVTPPLAPTPVDELPPVSTGEPGTSFGGGALEYGSGATASPSLVQDAFVFSEHLLFSQAPAELGVPLTLFSLVHYSGSLSEDVGVTFYDIFPVGGTLQKFQVGGSSVSFDAGGANSPVAATQAWTPSATGPHLIEVELSADFEQPLHNDAATRLISVGGSGQLSIDTVGQLLVDADGSGSITPGDTLRYTLTVNNSGVTDVSNAFIIDDFDETLLLAPNPSGNRSLVDGTIVWDLGTLVSGETRTVSYETEVRATNEIFPNTPSLEIPGEVVLANLSFVTGEGVPAGADSTRVLVTLAVPNTPPIAVVGGPFEVAEGNVVQLDGSSSNDLEDGNQLTYLWDLDGDGHFGESGVTAEYGDETGANPIFDASARDGVSTFVIGLRVVDSDGLWSEDVSTTVQVNNVAPSVSIAGPATAVPGQLRTFSGTFSDPGLADTHTSGWEIWDAANTLLNSGPGAHIEFVPETSGTYTIRFTVTDDDGDIGAAQHQLSVSAVGTQADDCEPGSTALVIGGTAEGDQIVASPGVTAGTIMVTLNGILSGPYQPTGRIIVYGLAGDDNIQFAGSITLAAWLYGQEGDDRLKGGAGNDLLQGGTGDDLLVGGSGRDLLIGGAGADRIVGNSDDDVLIAGTTSYDADEAALCAIMHEWTSERSYSQRIANLQGTNTGSWFDLRHNGDIFLTLAEAGTEVSVFTDDSEDVLTGSSGFDWFLMDLDQDRATDLKDEVFANDLEFIS
jgi:uncharacterized delta-60 repeat protein/uncharacterized repeat protein (TIGR01451 family)